MFFGLVIVEDKIGLVTKICSFWRKPKVKGDRIIATNGEAGYQATPLAPGLHWSKWVWQYSVHMQSFITILLVV
jgi:uncharacterized membrane protein YqiK